MRLRMRWSIPIISFMRFSHARALVLTFVQAFVTCFLRHCARAFDHAPLRLFPFSSLRSFRSVRSEASVSAHRAARTASERYSPWALLYFLATQQHACTHYYFPSLLLYSLPTKQQQRPTVFLTTQYAGTTHYSAADTFLILTTQQQLHSLCIRFPLQVDCDSL